MLPSRCFLFHQSYQDLGLDHSPDLTALPPPKQPQLLLKDDSRNSDSAQYESPRGFIPSVIAHIFSSDISNELGTHPPPQTSTPRRVAEAGDMQAPMISSPLKATNEIDWVQPLKAYIRQTYGDDPERYAEECATLNRLRQDMRGAGRDSAAGRDLLYRYYGQLELLDLRFPVDENHIKISFTW